VLNLLQDLKEKYGLTYLVIAHDLGMVRYLARRVVVMYLGKVVEDASVEELFERPLHPYSRALIAAVPTLERRITAKTVDSAEAPNPIEVPPGCRFHPRCPYAIERCRVEVPALRLFPNGTTVACHRAEEIIDDPIATDTRPIPTAATQMAATQPT
jgi:oligopeptide/dipeptide ABC transporter ATP-binding protein